MSANRLRIAFSLTATIVVVLSPSAVGRGQQTQPPVADPAAAAATLDPPAFAEELDAEPTLPSSLDPAVPPPSSEPPATDDSSAPPAPIGQAEPPRQMRSPWRFEVQLRPNIERAPILETLEAHGFDVREYSKRGDGTVTWWVAPPSEADLELSDRRLRETLGRQTSVKLVGFSDERIHPRLAQSVLTNPIKSWFFKWTPSETDAAKQKEEWQRVAEALAASKLDIRSGSTRESNGDWYVYVNSSAEDIPKIEDVVRTVVQEPRFFRPPQLKNYLAQHVSNESVPSGIAAADRPTVIREGSVGNTTHPFQVTLSHVDTGDFSSHERTLEDEGFDVQTSTRRSATSMRIAPPTGVDLKTAGQRLAEVLGPKAEIRDELSSVPPQVAFLADLLSTRHWFFKWKGTDEADRDRVLKALSDSDVAIAELTWSRDPDGSWQVAIDSSPLDVEKLDGLVRTLVKEPKIWRPIGAATPQSPPAAAPGTEVPADASEAPTNPAAETPDEPKLTAKVLLIESDWEKANDRQAASRLAQSISNGIVEMSRAGVEVFRPGYAATFQRDEARTASDDMQRLGLVSQSLAMSAVDLGLSEEGVEALGAAQLSFGEKSSDGMSESVAWNVLIVTGEAPGHFAPGDPYSAPPPPRVHRVAVVAWKDRTAERLRKDGSTATEAGELVPPAADASPPAPSDESERYVGSFFLRTDQSAIVPLTVPGVKGAAIVVSRAPKGPAVRSLGPLSGVATQQPMTADASVDWNELIRAYEASPLGAAATRARMVELTEDVSESAEAGEAEVTFNWRPAKEEQIDPLIDALANRYPQAQVVLRQFQGAQGATLVISVPASSAETIAKELETIAAAIIPSESVMQVEISPKVPEQKDGRATLVFHLVNASSDEVAKLLETLKLDPNIRLVSDPRTNSILLSAPDATKYKHVQALIDLLKALDQPAEEMPAKDESASTGRPDRRAEIDALRSQLAREEADVQQAAEMARAAPERERSIWVDSLRQVVVRTFDLRLRLQREEAAELRDRLAKIEENLARRQRIQSAVIERRIEVLLDPALEWPEVAPENALTPALDIPPASPMIPPSLPPPISAAPRLGPSDRRGDAFSAATSLAREISDLEEQAQAIEREGMSDGSEVRLALIRRQLELLRQEFDARQQALKLELESLNAKLRGAQASYERVRTMFDTGAISQEEVAKVEAELSAAKSDVARQEVLLQQYDRARASLPGESELHGRTVAPSTSSAPPTTKNPTANEAASGDFPGSDSVPQELQGVWRNVRTTTNGQSFETGMTGEWRFYGPFLFARTAGPDGDATYIWRVACDTSATPKRLTMHPVAFPFEDYSHIEDLQPGRSVYEVKGGRLFVASRIGHPGQIYPDYPTELKSGEGLNFAEYERVDASVVPVDDGVPAGDRDKWTMSTRSGFDSPGQRNDDQFAIATSLALRLAELARRIGVLETAQGPSGDEDSLASARSSFDLLRQEFDARENAAKRQLATAAESLAISEARLRSARQAHEAGKDSEEAKANPQAFGEALMNAHSDAEALREEVAFLEALLGHYARARATIQAASPATASVDPAVLMGTWRVIRAASGTTPMALVEETRWRFIDGKLIIGRIRKSTPQPPVEFSVELSQEDPGQFTKTLRQSDGTVKRIPVRFEIRGATLHVVVPLTNGGDLPGRTIPTPGATYYELERIADWPFLKPSSTETSENRGTSTSHGRSDVGSTDASVTRRSSSAPPELLGVWRMTKGDSGVSPVEAKATTFTFSKASVKIERDGEAGSYSLLTHNAGSTPGRATLSEYVTDQNGVQSIRPMSFIMFEVVEDTLKLVWAKDAASLPSVVGPSPECEYYEFKREAPEPNPASSVEEGASSTDDPKPAADLSLSRQSGS